MFIGENNNMGVYQYKNCKIHLRIVRVFFISSERDQSNESLSNFVFLNVCQCICKVFNKQSCTSYFIPFILKITDDNYILLVASLNTLYYWYVRLLYYTLKNKIK